MFAVSHAVFTADCAAIDDDGDDDESTHTHRERERARKSSRDQMRNTQCFVCHEKASVSENTVLDINGNLSRVN